MAGTPLATTATRRSLTRLLALGASVALLVGAVAPVAAARPTTSLGHQSKPKVTRIGTAHVGRRPAKNKRARTSTRPSPTRRKPRRSSTSRSRIHQRGPGALGTRARPAPYRLPTADRSRVRWPEPL